MQTIIQHLMQFLFLFLFKILNYKVDCSEILHNISFKINLTNRHEKKVKSKYTTTCILNSLSSILITDENIDHNNNL